ncbi:MAG: DUF1697 domain-containing protein [Acidimicrobiia bacterium]
MPIHVAFLRAINTGRRRVKNDKLCACFEAMGFEGVSAFLASGNVLFDVGKESMAGMETRIALGLQDCLGYEVPTFVRSATEVSRLASRQPFPEAMVVPSAGNVQVALLATQPTASDHGAALALATPEDALDIEDRNLYWLPMTTISESALNLGRLEAILGPMTIRTQRTMARLTAVFG